jgi:hypothetical protein
MTTTTPPVATVVPMSESKPGVARTAVLTTVAAVATNLIVFGLAHVAGVVFSTTGSTTTIGTGAVLATTALAMAVGWTLVALAVRRHRPTLGTVALIGGAFAALSTFAPLTLNADLSAKLVLTSLHLIAGAFYVVAVAVLIRARAGEAR